MVISTSSEELPSTASKCWLTQKYCCKALDSSQHDAAHNGATSTADATKHPPYLEHVVAASHHFDTALQLLSTVSLDESLDCQKIEWQWSCGEIPFRSTNCCLKTAWFDLTFTVKQQAGPTAGIFGIHLQDSCCQLDNFCHEDPTIKRSSDSVQQKRLNYYGQFHPGTLLPIDILGYD
jgi:hypothetical protein